ncbi:MAG: hypothetical protein AABX66_02860 [Nanoarchaeota archaeon]
MFFNKKTNCRSCRKEIENKFIFCPYCGKSTMSNEQIQKEFGLVGTSDEELLQNPIASAGILGQIIAPMMQNLMNSLNQEANIPEIEQRPNGISIKISSGNKVPKKRYQEVKPLKTSITQEQINKMTNLPRATAKTKVRRLSDKVIYDLDIHGVENIKDIFVSKLESGYEVKAIGKGKVYTNSLPINLPLLQYSFNESGVSLEFANQ